MRYLKLLALFLKTSLLIEMEYRFNFTGLFVLSLLNAAWSIAGALLFFSYRPDIGGWSFDETLVVIGLYFLAYAFVDTVMRPNIDDIVEHIRRGTLDFVLTKPVNAQVHATLRRFRFQKLSNALVGVTIIVIALIRLHHVPSVEQVLLFLLLCAGAAMLLYSAMTILGTLAFWAVDINNIDEFVVSSLEAGRYPASAFPEPVRLIISFVAPIAFITTVPAEVILGRLTPPLVLYGWLFALALLVISILFWRVAVRHYSSASS
jgi:ABC-2 type transport system permease protein